MTYARRAIYEFAAAVQRTPFRKELAAAHQRQYWSSAQIEQWQLTHLNELIHHAAQHVPAHAHLTGLQIRAITDIQALPFLTKDRLRHDLGNLTAQKSLRSSVRKITGGSTGAPVTLAKSRRGMSFELAATWRGMSWAGIRPGDVQARFWGVPHTRSARLKALLVDAAASRIRCSAFSFTNEDLDRYHRLLQKRKPAYCYGYVSMLREYAKHILDRGYAPPPSLRAVITTAEPLSPSDRTLLRAAFAVPVYDEYGCGEVGTIAHECSEGSLHINTDNVIVEILRDDGTLCAPGEEGNIVVTDLHNFATPLIRYALADSATFAKGECKCQIMLPALRTVQGRSYDVLINRRGERFHGEFFLYIFEDMKRSGVSINAFRITQRGECNIELEIAGTQAEVAKYIGKTFSDKMKQRFDEQVNVTTMLVDEIAREQSGKRRLIRRMSG